MRARTDRNEQIVARIRAGGTLASLAAKWGVTRQRVHQIAANLPLPCRCGCGELIPVTQPGHREYLPGHAPGRCVGCDRKLIGHKPDRRCRPCSRMERMNVPDLAGKTYGAWVVECPVTPCPTAGKRRWWCRCQCGTVAAVFEGNLLRGLSGSCLPCGYKRRNWRKKPTTP